MKRSLKCTAWLGALIVGLALANSASATIVVVNPNETTMNLGDWAGLGGAGYSQQDKNWVYLSSSGLSASLPLSFKFFTLGPEDQHLLSIGQLFQGAYSLDYSISVIQPSAFQIVQASLGVDPDGSKGNWSVTKTFYSDPNFSNQVGSTLTVSNSSPGNAIDTFPGVTTLYVRETWSIDSLSTVVSASNTYVQQVPEPASIAVWSVIGVVGLAFGWKYRKQRTI
jgi:hypothetical protein